jgi:hypothetical protein
MLIIFHGVLSAGNFAFIPCLFCVTVALKTDSKGKDMKVCTVFFWFRIWTIGRLL